MVETRDIRYIDMHVVPSDADRSAVLEEVTASSNLLASTSTDYAAFVRANGSEINYSDVPVNKTALPMDVAARLDSTGINEVYGPYYNQTDDSYNAFKIIAKTTAPDSIQIRQIQVYAETADKTKTLADSIYNALKGGSDFAEIAKIYGQSGEAVWMSARSWEGAELDAENTKYVNTLINTPVKELVNLEIGQSHLILQVMDKKSMQTKYKVAVIKRPVEFSTETYNAAYNKFSQFVAQNTTLDSLEVNAEEYGYTLIPRSDFSSAEHYVGGVKSTREALKWVFEAKPGEVSPLYECGENDHLMVVALERVNKAGYRNINHVADALRAEIRRDKKAEKIMAQMKNCTSIDQVKALENAVSDTVKHVTFSAPAYIAVTGRSELAVSAVAEKTAIDKTSAPIKGNGGVYMIQVYKKDKGSEEFDAKKEETTLANMAANIVSRQFMNDLYQRGKVEDKRYLYF